jgi:iron(III) transport system ATP-binding protein
MADITSRRNAAADAALAIDHVSHSYGALRVLADVSLRVDRGELVCLVGPSGCGKTTLLRLAAGLEDVQSGRIAIDGRRVAGDGSALPAEARGIGFVFQDYALFPHLDVAANVAFGLRGRDPASRARRVADMLRQVGMPDHGGAFAHELSGGQQQRVALARALAPEPRVLLLDEPFSGLDVRLRERIRDDTLHVLKRSGAATLMVTHDPEEAMFMADRLIVLNKGRIEQDGPPEEVYGRPASAFVATMFGQANEVRGQVRAGRVETPFGPVLAPVGLGEGAAVQVLVRPEALRLADAGDDPACPAKVIAARLLGRSSWVHLCLGPEAHDPAAGPETEDGHRHVHARVPGRFLPPEGSVLGIEIDPSQVFVFPDLDTR